MSRVVASRRVPARDGMPEEESDEEERGTDVAGTSSTKEDGEDDG